MQEYEQIDVLLVEDNPRDVEMTLRALRKRQLANRIFVVEDGAAALDFLFAEGDYSGRDVNDHPRVVFLDLKLPKVDGLEVLRRLKADPRTRAIPVVVVTSSNEECDVVRSYNLGANSYVVKPVDFDRFMAAAAELGCYWLMVNRRAPAEQVNCDR